MLDATSRGHSPIHHLGTCVAAIVHLQVFAHATLLKADFRFQYILNVVTVIGSVSVDA